MTTALLVYLAASLGFLFGWVACALICFRPGDDGGGFPDAGPSLDPLAAEEIAALERAWERS